MLWVPASVTQFPQNDFFDEQQARAQSIYAVIEQIWTHSANHFVETKLHYIWGNMTINCGGITV